jgi:hypothetical protein
MKIKDFSMKKQHFIRFHFDEFLTPRILVVQIDTDEVYHHLMNGIIDNYSLPN